ncbi:MAG TPA: mechanosensitive ion channel family protein [Thermoanaerobaculia bacterium]|nr:mechanosensitive ion channel family protein [Thermoanaerobaculia bacterium]
MNLDWLDDQLLGEPLRDWMMALAIAAAVLLVLALIKRIVVSRVSRLASRTETQADDFFVEMVRRTRWLLVLFPVLSLAAVSLDVPRLREHLKTAAILAFLLQLALWALVAINFWLESHHKRRTESDAASITMIRAFGFMGKVVLWSVILLLALENLGVDVTALIAGLGVGGVAVALALQNILGDLLASLSIVLDKPFVIGDTIQVDNFTGTVESIGIRTTHLRSVTGEQLVFSNGDLVRSRIRNHKRMGERRVSHAFDVVYQTPAEKVAGIPEIVRRLVDTREQLRFDHAHLVGLGESGLRFEAVWFVLSADNNLHLDLQQSVLLDLLRSFEAEGIEFAYPTRTLIDQRSERSFRA